MLKYLLYVFRYRPNITLEFMRCELGYDDTNDGRDSLHKFLTEQGAKLTTDNTRIECKVGLNPPSTQN